MFRRALRIAGLRPHDLRRSYAHLLEMAQVPRSRRLSYLGHSHTDTLDRHYEKHEVTAYLQEDSERCRKYIGESCDAARPESNEDKEVPQVFSGLLVRRLDSYHYYDIKRLLQAVLGPFYTSPSQPPYLKRAVRVESEPVWTYSVGQQDTQTESR